MNCPFTAFFLKWLFIMVGPSANLLVKIGSCVEQNFVLKLSAQSFVVSVAFLLIVMLKLKMLSGVLAHLVYDLVGAATIKQTASLLTYTFLHGPRVVILAQIITIITHPRHLLVQEEYNCMPWIGKEFWNLV